MSELAHPAAAGGGDAPASAPANRALTAELVLAGLTGTVINTSVTVAVVAIAEEFDTGIPTAAVLVVLLNVAMAFAMPFAGIAVRAFGPRRVLVGAAATVFGSSLLLSLSPNLFVFGAARLAQGLGSAALVPTSVLAATQLLDGEGRRRGLGWWAAANGLGLAFAPLVGGVLLDSLGWRWVTLPSCLLGLALVVAARLAIPATLRHDPGVTTGDVLALGLFTGTLMSTIAALSAGALAVAGALLASCLVALGLFRRRARRSPALAGPVRWLRDRDVRRSSTGAGLQMVSNGMVQITVPAWLITIGVLTAGAAGAVLMAMTLTMAAMGPISGRATGVSFERWFTWGLVGCAVGLGTLVVAVLWWWGLALAGLVALGLGAGALLSPSLTAFSHTVAGENMLGLAVFNVLRLSSFAVGGLIGASALDLGEVWVAFAVAAAVCLAAAFRMSKPSSARPASGR